jgi:hypothetical protein
VPWRRFYLNFWRALRKWPVGPEEAAIPNINKEALASAIELPIGAAIYSRY